MSCPVSNFTDRLARDNFNNSFDSQYNRLLRLLKDDYSTSSVLSQSIPDTIAENIIDDMPKKSSTALYILYGLSVFIVLLILCRVLYTVYRKNNNIVCDQTKTVIEERGKVVAVDSSLEIVDPTNIIPVDDRPTFVFFHAPWCGHCQELKPHFENQAMNPENYRIKFKMVSNDVLEKSPDVDKLSLRGFPTILVFLNGRVVDSMVGNQGSQALQHMVDKYAKA